MMNGLGRGSREIKRNYIMEAKNMDLGALLKRGMELKKQMNAIRTELGQIHTAIAAQASFRNGSKTCTMAQDGILCKVQQRDNVIWDQAQLRAAYRIIGAEGFSQAFDYEFKPISARALNAWMAAPTTPDQWRQLVSMARTVKTQSPSVSFEDTRGE